MKSRFLPQASEKLLGALTFVGAIGLVALYTQHIAHAGHSKPSSASVLSKGGAPNTGQNQAPDPCATPTPSPTPGA